MKIALVVVLALFVAGGHSQATSRSVLLNSTSLGSIIGTERLVGNVSVQQFAGLPYARAGRWQYSELWQGVLSPQPYSAEQFGPACAQANTTGWPYQSEDCLFANVWRPAGAGSDGSGLLPVLVYIHGGGWFSGSGSEPLYWGWTWCSSAPVIVVTFNYRLGVFGWLQTGDQANYGLVDQTNALRWVAAYIKDFGGDPTRVTLAGQSAGGISVAFHLVSPLSAGLFSKAAIHSGPVTFPALTRQQAAGYAAKLAGALGCTANDTACLQQYSTQALLDAQSHVRPMPVLPADHMSSVLPWSPVFDGDVVTVPVPLLGFGALSGMHLLVGFDKNDTGAWVGPARSSRVAYATMLTAAFGPNASAVQKLYPFPQATPCTTDFIMACPSLQALDATAAANVVSGWTFSHSPSSDPWNADTVSHCAPVMGPCHGEELTFVWGTAAPPDPSRNAPPCQTGATFTADELPLSQRMVAMWTDFVACTSTTSNCMWPVYSPASQAIVDFSLPNTTMTPATAYVGCPLFATFGVASA